MAMVIYLALGREGASGQGPAPLESRSALASVVVVPLSAPA